MTPKYLRDIVTELKTRVARRERTILVELNLAQARYVGHVLADAIAEEERDAHDRP